MERLSVDALHKALSPIRGERSSEQASTPHLDLPQEPCEARWVTGYPPGVPIRFRRRIPYDGSPWSLKRSQLARMVGRGTGLLVLLHGDRGTGKTQMGADLCWYVITQLRMRATYTTAADLFRSIRASFSEDGVGEVACIAKYASPALLVIDEAHERGNTDFEDRTLTAIVDKRYGNMVDTIIITNERAERMAGEDQSPAERTLGPSIWSRMMQTGGTMHANWTNYRAAEVMKPTAEGGEIADQRSKR